jgi:hypothetical protein
LLLLLLVVVTMSRLLGSPMSKLRIFDTRL